MHTRSMQENPVRPVTVICLHSSASSGGVWAALRAQLSEGPGLRERLRLQPTDLAISRLPMRQLRRWFRRRWQLIRTQNHEVLGKIRQGAQELRRRPLTSTLG